LTAAAWAERVRPKWPIVLGALIALSLVLDFLDVKNSMVVRVVLGVLLGGFYVFPWAVAICRNFASGYRGSDRPA
jgi:hypothetical protein